MTEKKFYVYAHRRLSDGSIFYIGKGHGKRAWVKSTRGIWWKRVEAKHGRSVHILARELPEICAFSLERSLISFYGRANLVNATDGGEGATGAKRSDEWKREMSRRMSGENNPMFGVSKTISELHKKRISEANSHPKPAGFGDVVRARLIGSRQDPNINAKRSASMKGRHAGKNNPMYGKRKVNGAWVNEP